MLREVMLAQASDWPFIMRTGTSPDYARKRVRDHLNRFWALDGMLRSGVRDEKLFEAICQADNIFPDCNPGWYASVGRR
jgi:1,4-alpha-glucan branching enzyme